MNRVQRKLYVIMIMTIFLLLRIPLTWIFFIVFLPVFQQFYYRRIMGTSEKFCLRWNDFETNISVAFRELREEKDFFDVTLACDDSQIQAHKVILSACSPFFRNVLRRNPHQHPHLLTPSMSSKS